MGNIFASAKLTEFQKEKLTHEFHQFYDLNADGDITWEDIELAKQNACKFNNWGAHSKQAKLCDEVFQQIWDCLTSTINPNNEGMINNDDWIELWQRQYKMAFNGKRNREAKLADLPIWCQKLIEHRFQLLDRTGDGVIDIDEFEYSLSHYEVRPKEARQCFLLISENHSRKVDLEYFTQLAAQFYFSNDPADFGNFISGKLDYRCSNEVPRKKYLLFE